MAVLRRAAPRQAAQAAARRGLRLTRARVIGPGARPLASPGQIAVIYRWGTWALALGLIVSGTSTTYGTGWAHHGDVYLLLGLTLLVNILVTLALRPYMRLMRRFPAVLVLDVVFCLAVYADSNIWTSPFQFYSYAALMLPVTIFFYGGAVAGSLLFLVLDVMLLYHAGDTLGWARAGGYADTYLMQLAIVPLLAFVFAYPNRLYAQLRRAQRRLDQVEREQLLTTERTRIAQSLHDSVAQLLFGIGMLAESALVRVMELGAPAAGATARVTTVSGGEDTPTDERGPLADTLGQVRDLAARGNQEMRRAIYALHEPSPSRRGLMVALRALLADCSARTGLETHLKARMGDAVDEPERAASGRRLDDTSVGERVQHDHEHAPDLGEIGAPMEARVLAAAEAGNSDGDTPSDDTLDELAALPEPVGEALYRVAREALANVEKHAQAFNVWVELSVRPAERHGARDVALVVRDDGQGFRRMLLSPLGLPDEDDDGLMHFGTGNMRRDMEAVGGKVEITSVPGRGTTVRATAPIT